MMKKHQRRPSNILDFLISTSSQGLLWSILAIGVYLSFRILDIPDMTVEGAYLGAAVTATFIVNGWSPLLATIAGFLAGVMTGFVTGSLQTAMHIPGLLAGILTMTALYSINLRVMGKSNQVLLDQETLLTQLEALGIPHNVRTLVLGLIAMIIVIMLLVAFMYTELGLNLRAGNIKLLSAILLAIIVWLSHLTTRRKQKKVA